MSNIIYLASPYTHKNKSIMQLRYKQVSEFGARLIKLGMVVFAPIPMSVPIAKYGEMTGAWDTWKHLDLTFLKKCKAMIVYKLSGWDSSLGVNEEVIYAKANRIPIYYVDQDVDDNELHKIFSEVDRDTHTALYPDYYPDYMVPNYTWQRWFGYWGL